MQDEKIKNCEDASRRIKKLVYDVIHQTKSHHIGSILSCLDIVTVLYFAIMNIDPKDPGMKLRDRFILSKGHAGMAQYAVLAVRGYFPEVVLDDFGKDGTKISTHPDKDCLPGVEISTGSLGHGLSIGVGAALAAKQDDLPSRVFVLMSDGECNEGSIWEAAMFAGHHQLDQLTLIVDKNGLQAFGTTDEILNLDLIAQKFESFGWSVKTVDGHNIPDLISVFEFSSLEKGRPTVIIANTVKGKGIPSIENTLHAHYTLLDDALYQEALDHT
jgi:transketolase